MKIAFVYDAIYPYIIGGVQKRNWELASRLVHRGHEVTLFGMKHWGGEDITYREGVRLWGVCPPQELFTNGRRSIKEAIYFSLKVLPALLKGRFDIIDVANFPYFPCFSAKVACLTKRIPLVVTWHEVWGNYWFEYLGKKGVFGKAVERMTTCLTNRVIAVSQTTKSDLQKIGCSKNATVVPNGIDSQSIAAISPSQEESDVIFAGRLIKEKNVDLLIKAVNLIKNKVPNVYGIIIGDGPERDNLSNLVQSLNLEKNICFKGFVERQEEVFSYMKSSKVFVLPSQREGLGIVALEANACGLPVVTVNHPQNAACELIKEGVNGFICELCEQDMSEKMLRAVNEISSSSCKESVQRYDWEGIVSQIEVYYYDVL